VTREVSYRISWTVGIIAWLSLVALSWGDTTLMAFPFLAATMVPAGAVAGILAYLVCIVIAKGDL
jgi:hypothetical protein